jgi:hypothetical protein
LSQKATSPRATAGSNAEGNSFMIPWDFSFETLLLAALAGEQQESSSEAARERAGLIFF